MQALSQKPCKSCFEITPIYLPSDGFSSRNFWNLPESCCVIQLMSTLSTLYSYQAFRFAFSVSICQLTHVHINCLMELFFFTCVSYAYICPATAFILINSCIMKKTYLQSFYWSSRRGKKIEFCVHFFMFKQKSFYQYKISWESIHIFKNFSAITCKNKYN